MGLWAEIGIAYLAVRMLFKCTTAIDDNRVNEVRKLVTNFSKLSPGDVISYGIVSNIIFAKIKYTTHTYSRIPS